MTKPNQTLADAYREMITSTIERTCIKQIEERDGKVPDIDSMKFNGGMSVTPESGIVMFTWKEVPMCEYIPAGYGPNGAWRDAQIAELRIAVPA